MKTREDYADMEALAKKIAPDEDMFILRRHDIAAPAAIQAWINRAGACGADPSILDRAQDTRRAMIEWQARNGSKVPDLPEELLTPEEKQERYRLQRMAHRDEVGISPSAGRGIGTSPMMKP